MIVRHARTACYWRERLQSRTVISTRLLFFPVSYARRCFSCCIALVVSPRTVRSQLSWSDSCRAASSTAAHARAFGSRRHHPVHYRRGDLGVLCQSLLEIHHSMLCKYKGDHDIRSRSMHPISTTGALSPQPTQRPPNRCRCLICLATERHKLSSRQDLVQPSTGEIETRSIRPLRGRSAV
jgi:hypothetical protein